MSLHPGMEFVFTKGELKGRKGMVVDVSSSVAGNEVLIKTSKSQYWVDKDNLEKRVKWLQQGIKNCGGLNKNDGI